MFTVGMIVICSIKGIVYMDNIPFQVSVPAEGYVRVVGEKNLLVNFSKFVTKETDFKGDYSKYLITKEDCVKRD